jgi:hypothetical protein
MSQCITCGSELHPERAVKYDYCTSAECQAKNFKGLTMVGIGMNKAAEELIILDDQARQDLASGKYRDQRRGNFGQPAHAAGSPPAVSGSAPAVHGRPDQAGRGRAGSRTPAAGERPRTVARQPWSRSQEKLALLYNEQGLRPADIAAKLGVSNHLVTQIILAAKNRGKS